MTEEPAVLPGANAKVIRKVIVFLPLILPLALYAYITLSRVDQPGLYEDEAWGAVHAARFAVGSKTIDSATGAQFRFAGRAWPFMRNTYVGPVKSYILLIPFVIFGPSSELLHIVGTTFGLLTLAILFVAMLRTFGLTAAIVGSTLLATDLSFAIATKSDWGPNAFALFASTLGFALLLEWARCPPGYLFPALTGLVFGLGRSTF